MNYISYLRVSTTRQSVSGLGLEAQREAVSCYMRQNGNRLLAEFVEVESGKRNDRPQLANALAECKKRKAVLVIAKLDRLARNVHFISGLMESGVDFVAVDMPTANKLTVHILAAVAEWEREQISARTKAALARSTKKLGGYRGGDFRNRDREKACDEFKQRMLPIVTGLRKSMTYRQIADELNSRGIPTFSGKAWGLSSVQSVLR